MSEQVAARNPQELMEREMRVTFGPVPEAIENSFYNEEDIFVISDEEFLFTSLDHVRYHYRRGAGLTVQLPPAGLDSDYELFLWGTVFGAVAWLNGLVPLHASAVDVGGRIVAFTADSGGGKSTLAAGLAGLGLPHVCDDTLVVSVDPDGITALPDAKPLKLWDDALVLTNLEAARPVPSMPGKHYASASVKALLALPLTDLVFIEKGERIEIEPVTGAAKFGLLPEALYRRFVHVARGDRAVHEQFILRFCSKVRFWRLRRPFDPLRFGADLQSIKAMLLDDMKCK